MKGYLILSLLLFMLTPTAAQKTRTKSNPIAYKGATIIAEEKRLEQEERKKEEERAIQEAERMRQETALQLAAQSNIEAAQMPSLETLGLNENNIPKYYALIMGVSIYQNTNKDLPNLDYPVLDAKKLADVLKSKYTFISENVQVLENPTRSEIIESLEQLSEKITQKDNLLVFYAGHGHWDKPKEFGYWLPSDADPVNKSQWIANSTLIDYLGAIKSKHTLLIADACFSGSIFKTRSLDASSMILKFHELYKNKSRKAITSGNLTSVPDKSVFIEYFVKELEDNQNVFLHSRLLFSKMYEPISNNSKVLPQYGVIQNVGDDGGDFIFIKKK